MSAERKNEHDYRAHLIWDGNLGDGTSTYAGYGRRYRIQVDGKPDLKCSSDPIFRGERDSHNPEDLFVASLSGCHLLSYLALCARSKVNVVAYEDDASGILKLRPDGGGSFESVTLRPIVTITPESDERRALELHETAHDLCFIAASVSIPVHHEPQIKIADASSRTSQTSTQSEARP